MIFTFINFVKLAIAWEFFGTVNPSTVCSVVTLRLQILSIWITLGQQMMLVSMLPPVRNCLWSNAGKPLDFLDDSLTVPQVTNTTCIQAHLTVDCLAVGQVVLEAWPLLPGHSLNLLPGRLLHLLVPGQVEDTPGPIG